MSLGDICKIFIQNHPQIISMGGLRWCIRKASASGEMASLKFNNGSKDRMHTLPVNHSDISQLYAPWARPCRRGRTEWADFSSVTRSCGVTWAAVWKQAVGWLHASWRNRVLVWTLPDGTCSVIEDSWVAGGNQQGTKLGRKEIMSFSYRFLFISHRVGSLN